LDLHGFIEQVVTFLQNNPLITLIAVFVFGFLVYRRPKTMLSILILILFLVSIYYVIIDMSSSAKSEKQRLIDKSEESSTIKK
jgi:hypothetical protein